MQLIQSRFGIPTWLKRDIEDKALNTMGENKASYLTKSYVDKIPASDQKDVNELKKGVGNAAGGVLQNPLGGFVRSSKNSLFTGSSKLTYVFYRLATLPTILPSPSLAVERHRARLICTILLPTNLLHEGRAFCLDTKRAIKLPISASRGLHYEHSARTKITKHL